MIFKRIFIFVAFTIYIQDNAIGQVTEISLEDFFKAILAVENRIPKGTSYQFATDYFMYDDLSSTSASIILHSNLCYQASKSVLSFEQFGKFIIQTKDIQITCDTAMKQLILNKANPALIERRGLEDFKALLHSKCKAFIDNRANYKVYTIQFAEGARFKNAELWIQNDGMVKKYILRAGVDVLYESENEERLLRPKMEIRFSDYLTGSQVDLIELRDISTYFVDLDKKILHADYAAYEIIDLRY